MGAAERPDFDRLADLAARLRQASAIRRHQLALGLSPTSPEGGQHGEFASAAICYILAADPSVLDPSGTLVEQLWPYDVAVPDGTEPVPLLERAVALLLSEISRQQVLTEEPDARPNLQLVKTREEREWPAWQLSDGFEFAQCQRCKVTFPAVDLTGDLCAWCVEDDQRPPGT